MPEEDPCAPCEVNFSTRMRGVVCDMELILAESYTSCRDICEDILGVEDEKTPHKKAEAIENCKCLCKELMLKDICSGIIKVIASHFFNIYWHVAVYCIISFTPIEDSCNHPFKEIQCSNISSNSDSTSPLSVTRCFERSFDSAQAFNECATDSNEQVLLPSSILESLDPYLKGGVEQCACDCKYVEKQSPTETSTGLSKIELSW